jgi:hypothetical protein
MPDFFDQLIARVQQKHTTPTGTPSTPYYTGPAGLFGVPGLERELISTRIQPRGLASTLPVRPSVTMTPMFPYITGFRDESGSDPATVCADGPTPGTGKSCLQTAAFGRYTYMTRELELNRLGQKINRGEFQDFMLVNPPLVETQGGILGDFGGSPNLVNEVMMRFLEVGIAFQNKLMRQVWAGNPANNNIGGGYSEFPGLDILIGTNKVDAITGNECPSLDSDIKDFNYENVSTGNIVNVMSYMMRYLRDIASRTNFEPVNWAIVMRPALFWELTAVWPCSYLTYRCASPDNFNLNIDAADQVRMRDDMRSGQYIMLDGVRYPVILDDGIAEDTNTTNGRVPNPCFGSDIYVIPITAGGMVTTYWEYFDYNQGAMVGVQEGQLGDFFWTDGGMYLWHKKPPLNWCVQWIAKIEPRIILRTPQLAGRITNIVYCPLQHERQPFPDDPYFVNRGVYSTRANSSLYSDWSLPQE